MMKSMYGGAFLMIIGVLFMIGCDAALVRDGRIIGVHAGQFVYSDGYLRMNYKSHLDVVWKACEKTVADLNAMDVKKDKKIATGTIKSIIQDEKVTIVAEYVSKEVTTVSILVGLTGNNIASQLIQEKIGVNLQKMTSDQGSSQAQSSSK